MINFFNDQLFANRKLKSESPPQFLIALRRRIPTRCDILNVRLCISFSGGVEMVQNSVVYNKNRKFGNLDLKSLEICGDKKLPQPKLAENLLPRSAKDVPSTCYYQTWQV